MGFLDMISNTLNSNRLDENGYAKCIVCGKKVKGTDAQLCTFCDRFACNSCSTKKQGFPACKKCANR